MSLQSSLADDLAERTENEKVHLTAAKEENVKLKEVLQSEINEYKVYKQLTVIIVASYSVMQCITGAIKAVCYYYCGT